VCCCLVQRHAETLGHARSTDGDGVDSWSLGACLWRVTILGVASATEHGVDLVDGLERTVVADCVLVRSTAVGCRCTFRGNLCNSLRPAGVWLSGNQKPDGTVSAQLVLASDLPVPQTNLAATYASGEPMVLTGAWTAGRLVLHGIDRELNPPPSEGDYVREKSFDWDSALAAPGDMQATGTLITRTVNRETGAVLGSMIRSMYLNLAQVSLR
jgi:hypothetical protein